MTAARVHPRADDEWKALIGLGRTALAANQPALAVFHLTTAAELVERLPNSSPADEGDATDRSQRQEAHEWLAAALFAQSTAPHDRFARAAFAAAERARVDAHAVPAARALAPHEVMQRMSSDETIIEFLVGEDQALAWVVTAGHIFGYPLPPPPSLDADVRRLQALVAANDANGVREHGERLAQTLMGPALPRLHETRRVILVLDGPLKRLPFAALRLPPPRRGWLVQHVQLSTTSSATASLERAFGGAETASPLTSLWDAGDDNTAALMQTFNAGIAAGVAPDAALRTAQLAMIRSRGARAEPAAWAGFVAHGDSRRPVVAARVPFSAWDIASAVSVLVVAAVLALQRRLPK